ncbi:MAG TPA: hypothetical protein PKD86_15295 [Gemmatales bacterium]|nr:hypothetical protein [Gemmatales bacterium]HMP60709.1 hypothetical protein [Gemmatales bacterium]
MAVLRIPLSPAGPIVPLQITVGASRRQALLKAGQPVPPPIQLAGLLHTGASMTVIDRQLLRRLGLSPTGAVKFKASAQGMSAEISNAYDVGLSLVVGGSTHRLLDPLAVLEGGFSQPEFQALLGRDVLGRLRIEYDGPNRQVAVTLLG